MAEGRFENAAAGEASSPDDSIEAARRLADHLWTEVEELRLRLAEAEETIRAIRAGEVDAFVVAGPEADRVFTLETAEHPYRRLVEAMHQAAVTVSADGTILYANKAFAGAVGESGNEILGRSISQFFSEASRPAVADLLTRDSTSRCEVLLARADGSLLPMRMAASSYPGEAGVLGLILTDLTDQRRLEEVIAAESLSRLILEQTVDAVVVGDPGGTLIRAGAAARRLCGREPAGLSFDEAFPLLRPGETTSSRFALPLSEVISGQTLRGLEVRLEHPGEGRVFELHLAVGPLKNSEGLIVGFVATLTDLTERRRAEKALQARERELQSVANNTPDILVRFDRRLRHLFINASIKRITGRAPHEFLGKTNRELGMPADLCDIWDDALNSVFETGQPHSFEFDFETPEGVRHYAARLVPESDAEESVRTVLGVTHDVTDRKLYEQALHDQDRRKDEFLATLAHEVRNPLAAIGNAALTASQAPEDEETSRWALDVIQRQSRQLSHLVDDLLDVSRINLGKIDLRRTVIDARESLNRAAEAVRPQVNAKGQILDLRTHETPLFIHADPTRFEQILVNLLGNASKYNDQGGRITISAHTEGTELAVEVADNGIGIAPKDLRKIFEPFGQVDESLDRSHGGLGIGLTLVKRLVDLHGGSISVRSEGLGRGSSFTVRLPRTDLPVTTSPTPSDASPARTHGIRVLIVDDNADGVAGLARLLRRKGYEVETATDGHTALDLAAATPPTVALLDIGLPSMDGYQLASHLRQRFGDSITLYAVSGYGREEDQRKAKEAGFDGYTIKPVDLNALLALLPKTSRHSGGG